MRQYQVQTISLSDLHHFNLFTSYLFSFTTHIVVIPHLHYQYCFQQLSGNS
jgi:hypothetical protein